METKITQKDLIGDLENFPIEVVEKMLIEQFKQLGKTDIAVFQYNRNILFFLFFSLMLFFLFHHIHLLLRS